VEKPPTTVKEVKEVSLSGKLKERKTMGLIFPNGPNFFWFSPIFLKKEEVVMKYSFTCPAPCNYEIKIDAQNDDEALKKIMEAGVVHAKKAHPNMPPMTEEKLKNMFRSGMKKG
jgi:predicted small metal-binding protein